MKTIEVISSNLLNVGYDPKNLKLFVTFKGNTLYKYDNVPSEIVCNLLFSESIGGYFNKNIKNNYAFTKL